MEFLWLVQSSPNVLAAVSFLSLDLLTASSNFIHYVVNYLFSFAQDSVPTPTLLFLSLLNVLYSPLNCPQNVFIRTIFEAQRLPPCC